MKESSNYNFFIVKKNNEKILKFPFTYQQKYSQWKVSVSWFLTLSKMAAVDVERAKVSVIFRFFLNGF